MYVSVHHIPTPLHPHPLTRESLQVGLNLAVGEYENSPDWFYSIRKLTIPSLYSAQGRYWLANDLKSGYNKSYH